METYAQILSTVCAEARISLLTEIIYGIRAITPLDEVKRSLARLQEAAAKLP